MDPHHTRTNLGFPVFYHVSQHQTLDVTTKVHFVHFFPNMPMKPPLSLLRLELPLESLLRLLPQPRLLVLDPGLLSVTVSDSRTSFLRPLLLSMDLLRSTTVVPFTLTLSLLGKNGREEGPGESRLENSWKIWKLVFCSS